MATYRCILQQTGSGICIGDIQNHSRIWRERYLRRYTEHIRDLDDFFALEGGKYGRGIINNAKTKIILNLEDEEAQRVQELLHLSEAETLAITHFERGNGLISTNNNNVTVEFKASDLEKELITTDRRELQQILKKKQQATASAS